MSPFFMVRFFKSTISPISGICLFFLKKLFSVQASLFLLVADSESSMNSLDEFVRTEEIHFWSCFTPNHAIRIMGENDRIKNGNNKMVLTIR